MGCILTHVTLNTSNLYLTHLFFLQNQNTQLLAQMWYDVKLVVGLNEKNAFQAGWIIYLFHQALVAVKTEALMT